MPENKDNMIALRLSSQQYAYVVAWADTHDVTVSEVIRRSIQHMIPEAKA
jgi:hypothetical protein